MSQTQTPINPLENLMSVIDETIGQLGTNYALALAHKKPSDAEQIHEKMQRVITEREHFALINGAKSEAPAHAGAKGGLAVLERPAKRASAPRTGDASAGSPVSPAILDQLSQEGTTTEAAPKRRGRGRPTEKERVDCTPNNVIGDYLIRAMMRWRTPKPYSAIQEEMRAMMEREGALRPGDTQVLANNQPRYKVGTNLQRKRLEELGYIEKDERNNWSLTEKGRGHAKQLEAERKSQLS